MEQGRDADGAAGNENPGAGDRAAASALALCASQWRRAGGGIQGARPSIRSGGRRISSWAWSNPGSPRAATPARATASRCCATPMATACPTSAACSSTISIRRSAWRWSATISTSPTPTPSSAIPTPRAKPRSRARHDAYVPLPGGPIDHHWTKSLVASADGSLLYVGVGSNSNITENGMRSREEPRRHPGRSTAPPAAGASSRADCAIRTA